MSHFRPLFSVRTRVANGEATPGTGLFRRRWSWQACLLAMGRAATHTHSLPRFSSNSTSQNPSRRHRYFSSRILCPSLWVGLANGGGERLRGQKVAGGASASLLDLLLPREGSRGGGQRRSWSLRTARVAEQQPPPPAVLSSCCSPTTGPSPDPWRSQAHPRRRASRPGRPRIIQATMPRERRRRRPWQAAWSSQKGLAGIRADAA
jgi:hypothetical protein